MLDTLYQELIIDHGTSPRNCIALETPDKQAEGFNAVCGDAIKVYVLLENDKIKKVTFTGQGCAISTASASLMTQALVGKDTLEANALFKAFQNMLVSDNTEPLSESKLNALSGVKKFPMRVKCATLAWHTLHHALTENQNIACTESDN